MRTALFTLLIVLGVATHAHVWAESEPVPVPVSVPATKRVTGNSAAVPVPPAACDLSKVMIVMSRGRSGSSYVSDVLTKVLTGHSSKLPEILGSDSKAMEKLSRPPLQVIQAHLCDRGESHYRGFKWKPYNWDEGYLQALRWVAANNIAVVYSKRNPLDIYLSDLINRAIDLNDHEKKHSHCKAANDEACLKQHIQYQLVTVNTSHLLNTLRQVTDDDDRMRPLLTSHRVRYLDVHFEKLTPEHSSNATVQRAWREVFEFVAPEIRWEGPRLSMRALQASIVPTSSTAHRDKIRNYEEVQAALRGTRFARLLD